MRSRYFLFGLVVLGLLAVAEYRGWSLLSIAEAQEGPVPASVRNNPGAYRAVYISSGRYTGGK
ncbi:MAG TPA: hypothetical protein VGA70_08595 [Longimicrobiales bacterium]